ncbi:oleate hydratase [Candidatus Falkowbacteria bacterium]|uniref:Oleate hydratase n=1 Tax=Candidatus Buchananbacteria bacterium CG10_big_fil_rev_8_21_14_0_10_33_19 TaxID=1974525 RepID=A0A2H0W4Y1_9BACT|nr:oleate hydratase [Candidatus Falkowbacteria bacterium]PIS06408.1 MAG: oleate hydratase [Candidatus Buchananbacteria bacterium CG10_big_fil_rev_8_21_14_0_10_33_19]
MIKSINNRKAYIIGSGIAGLSTAVFLIKDAGFDGKNIFIFDKNKTSGGSLDGHDLAKSGYLVRGYRMFEREVYLCTYDLLSKIPSPNNRSKTLKDDIFDFNKKVKIQAKARLIEKGQIVNAHKLGLNWQDRYKLVKLLLWPENFFASKSINSYFTVDFFKTNFWLEWATTFAFEPWHSLLEMKRYMVRFIHTTSSIDTMEVVVSAPYCEYDFMVRPVIDWLKQNQVNFRQNYNVDDIELDQDHHTKIVTSISFVNNKKSIKVQSGDLVFVTNGSITASSSAGSMTKMPNNNFLNHKSLWQKIAKKSADFGQPNVFFQSINKSSFESFTITFDNELFFELVEKLTGNLAGTGGLITFKGSNWLMSIALPYQPYFINQPKNVFVCWGYGLLPNKIGNYVKKKMSGCTGQEILEELCAHLGFTEYRGSIIAQANCVPVMLPYITSQFMPRHKNDRPLVVPKGSKNLAFIGQYVEIKNEIVFTVESSVRSAKIAVKKLLNLNNKVPLLYQRQYNIRFIVRAIMTILR